MIEKELDLITWDNIQLDHCYYTDVKHVGGRIDYKLAGAFSDEKPSDYDYGYNLSNLVGITTNHKVKPEITKNVKALGRIFKVNVLAELGIGGTTTLKQLTEDHPDLGKIIKSMYIKGWMEEVNKHIIEKRENYKSKIQKQYNELTTAYTELGLAKDLQNLQELDTLLYCEAQGFMEKLETRIAKCGNAKNLKIHKALQTIRNKHIVTCTDG